MILDRAGRFFILVLTYYGQREFFMNEKINKNVQRAGFNIMLMDTNYHVETLSYIENNKSYAVSVTLKTILDGETENNDISGKIDKNANPFTSELYDWLKGDKKSFETLPFFFDSGDTDDSFKQRVLTCLCKDVKWGRTISYKELAGSAGNKNAARAAGNIVAGNNLPFIIPCHRVIHQDGRTGNFSIDGATKLKQYLLDREQKSK